MDTLVFGVMQLQQLNPLRSTRQLPIPIPYLNPDRLKFSFDSRRRMMEKDVHRLFYAVDASAASSAPDLNSGQFVGPKPKRRRQSVTGIDQDELLDPKDLADPDSCFVEFKGVEVHYKVCDAESEAPSSLQERSFAPTDLESKMFGLCMVLLHGFGASAFSWHKVMKPLARIIGSKVLAFDRPAFGLTSRVSYRGRTKDSDTKSINPYTTLFSALTTLHFIDLLGSDKAVIVGHSAGAVTAVRSYFEAPDRVAALILVAPAIVAPLTSPKVIEGDDLPKANKGQEYTSGSEKSTNMISTVARMISMFFCNILLAFKTMFAAIKDVAASIYRAIVSTFLRSAAAVFLVRLIMNYFGIAAIRQSWYDESKITDHTLNGYTKPLKSKGWERALLEYVIALLTDSGDETKPSKSRGIHEISCPVLIIAGDTDRLVPAWNAERLSRAIPRSHLEVVKNCGHLPHEEKPEEFLSIVQRFLQNVVTGPNLSAAVPT